MDTEEVMRRYPRLTAHVIAESLGYATPSCAARILNDAREQKENCCEWIYSCYGSDPVPAVKSAIRNRHNHKGFMAEYKLALAIVRNALDSGDEPLFASWF